MSESQLRNVIRPAILQPPQALTCPENPVVSLVTKKQAHIQVKREVILLTKICLELNQMIKKKQQNKSMELSKAVQYSTA